MLKEVLLAAIPIGCAGAGKILSNGKKRRAEVIGEILAALRVLRLRMLNSMEPLSVLLRKSDSLLLRELGNSLWVGSSLSECWALQKKLSVKKGGLLDSLTAEDIEILDILFDKLGKSGRDEQGELFSTVIERLEQAQIGARRKQTEAARIYTALGALAGVTIAILLV